MSPTENENILTLGNLHNLCVATVVHWMIIYILVLLLTKNSQKYLELHVQIFRILTWGEHGLKLSLLQEYCGAEWLRTWASNWLELGVKLFTH